MTQCKKVQKALQHNASAALFGPLLHCTANTCKYLYMYMKMGKFGQKGMVGVQPSKHMIIGKQQM